MGKIHKTAGSKHESSLSPVQSEFIKLTSGVKLRDLPEHLSSFPRLWPFPRGEMYHWIPVLNRFDDILANFISHYGLDVPQTRPFGSSLLRAADTAGNDGQEAPPATDLEHGEEGDEDRELIDSILKFSIMLLSNCGNRSLYSSSDRLSDLLNSTSLSLVKTTLQLSHLLAKRYFASKQRTASVGSHGLLNSHYNINLDRVRRLAAPFAKPPSAGRQSVAPSIKGKEKAGNQPHRASIMGLSDDKISGADLVAMVKGAEADKPIWNQWGEVSMSFYGARVTTEAPDHFTARELVTREPEQPPTPSIRRTSNLAPQATSKASAPLLPDLTPSRFQVNDSSPASSSIELDYVTLFHSQAEEVLRQVFLQHSVPQDSQYELLQKVRIAKAFISGTNDRFDLVAIRLLAIANLAYIDSDATFQSKISQQDSEEPRRLQLAYQLSEMVHPPDEGSAVVPVEIQTLALATLDALTKQKSRVMDVYTALSANVNHGILFYVVRKGVAQLAESEETPNMQEEDWRQALFDLLTSLTTSIPRAGDSMMSAGLMEVLVEIIGLRTNKAERNHYKVLSFLDNFIYTVREGYQALANAKGLDAIKDLTSSTITSSFSRAKSGEGMPDEFKPPNTDYKIPFYQQLTLRWLCKFINHLMSHNGANFGRQLRNLIDSPEILKGLRIVLSNADIFGSNVWSGAVNIFSTFIHNEPTSYSVIAESRLGEVFLEAITQEPVATSEKGKEPAAKNDNAVLSTFADSSSSRGILPVAEAITAIPAAFGALCLNEAGKELVKDSGALNCFFKIFESPAHIKAMEHDPDLPSVLGAAFDELVRHQPTLRDEILTAVRGMVDRVGFLCHGKAVNQAYGAKIWIPGPDGKLYIAGGRYALGGSSLWLGSTGTTDDVDMTAGVTSTLSNGSDSAQVSREDFLKQATDTISIRGPRPTSYMNVAVRFLIGFLGNSTMCAAFIDNGGLDSALDLATLPCLPSSFERSQCSSLFDDLGTMIKQLVEQKPHITLPAVINRLEASLDALEPVLEHDAKSGFFSPFTKQEETGSSPQSSAVLSDGTKYAKALITVNVLNAALASAFSPMVYNPRQTTNIFTQVNLADVYVRLVERLGKLHKCCLWEETLLLENMPADWSEKKEVSDVGFGTEEADNVLGIVHSTSSYSANGTLLPSDGGINGTSTPKDEPTGDTYMQHENIRVLKYLLCHAPISISAFFQSLGKLLITRRTTDAYQKQNAVKVSDQLAAWVLEELKFELPLEAPPRHRYSYWIVILTSMSRLMIDDSLQQPSPQILTLIVQSFKNNGGFAAIENVLTWFFEEAKDLIAQTEDSSNVDSAALLNLAMSGIKIILEFYSRVINSRYVNDATQTASLTPRAGSRDSADFFSAAQFLVELRKAVLQPARKMWDESESAFMDKATTYIVKSLIEILRIELEGDSESGALTRADKVPRKHKSEPKKWVVKNNDILDRLSEEYGRDLATEALFRCYDVLANAREYCQVQKTHRRAARTPVPPNDIPSPRNGTVTPGPVETSQAPPPVPTVPLLDLGLDTNEGLEQLTQNLLAEHPGSTLDAGTFARLLQASRSGTSRDVSASPAQEERIEAGKIPDMVTLDDLNEDRAVLKASLIDRCLDILNVHDDVTFELCDLISAAVASKSSSQGSLRIEITSTLLSSLTSLQMEDLVEDEARLQGKKIASYAHLFALVLLNRDFYDAVRDDLSENFSGLVSFLKLEPNHKVQDASPFIGQVLLILERLLTDDASPHNVEYKPPREDEPSEDHDIVELIPGLISLEEKSELFEAILEILPHIGKDHSLALSASRILVFLTRSRPLAFRLGEKQNIRRLFSMVKQLHGIGSDKLQSAFLLILRHIIEDDDTLRNIMRSEIQATFEDRRHRNNNHIDTTAYTRNLAHLVLRSPQIFVEVTNEKVKIQRYDKSHVQQVLTLKKEESAYPTLEIPGIGENGSTKDDSNGGKSVESASTEGNKVESGKSKASELKTPVVENPDGVIHFILGELLAYKDVEDTEISSPAPEKTKPSTPGDIEMTNGQGSDHWLTRPTSDQQKKPEKTEFKAENHQIYIYRCFLLQCLTELLSCYNRTKIEFINFKRKADPQGTTPSKPRSFVLNYLLNNLIPTGALSHSEDIPSRKRTITSSWTMSTLVSLCSKTGEAGYNRSSRDSKDQEDEPELLFVRRFVLEHAIRSFKDAQSNSEALEQKYSRLLNLADLFHRMLTGKPNTGNTSNSNITMEMLLSSQTKLAKIMYEKNFISALTGSIADIDLNFPGAKRAVKYILRPLSVLTKTAHTMTLDSDNPIAPGGADDDDISSDSSVSDLGDTREETPDLFRNSALGILDPGREEDTESDSEDDDDDEDEEMYEDEYVDEMEYEEEMQIHDHDDVISDEEQEIAEMGPIEGLPGDVGMDISVEIGGDDEEDMSDSDEDSDDMDEDGEDMDEDADDMEDLEGLEAGEGGSIGADDEGWDTDEGDLDGEDYPGQDDIEDDRGLIADMEMIRVLQGGAPQAILQGLPDADFGGGIPEPQDYLDDEMPEEEDEDEEEDYEEEDFAFEPELDGVSRLMELELANLRGLMRADDDEIEVRGIPWGWEGPGDPHAHARHHHHHHVHPNRGHPFGLFAEHRDRLFPPTSAYRNHRAAGTDRERNIDGVNPLLQRSGRPSDRPPGPGRRPREWTDLVRAMDPMRPGFPPRMDDGPLSFINNIINVMSQQGGPGGLGANPNQTFHLHIGPGGPFPGGPLPRDLEAAIRFSRDRRTADHPSRISRDDPTQSVAFVPTFTTARWQEESRLIFGAEPAVKATRVSNYILKLLAPPAMEAEKRREKEQKERDDKLKEEREVALKAKAEAEEKERDEREAKEKEEAEEREAAEAAAAALRAEQGANGESEPIETSTEVEQMEDVKPTEPTDTAAESSNAGPSEPVPRVVTTIRGREVDITDLGIDLEYFEALPEEFREEVLMQQIHQQRSAAAASGQEPSEISPEFLEALPTEIREELLQQEALERRRREREEARRRNAASGGGAAAPAQAPEEIDPATFFAGLEPGLRAALLADTDEDVLQNLPAEMQAEARALAGHRRLDHFMEPRIARGRGLDRQEPASSEQVQKRKPTQYVQILDKAGVATLLRLMFIPQNGSAKQSLNAILRDVCNNKQNRAEVVSILLSILQDGSNDVNAVERSFAHLSLRAKQPSAQKTPQPKRATPELTSTGEMSPLMIVQQCLNTLEVLTQYNPRIAEFFLTEHETGTGFKPRSARKGKGKETKASKYPLNALLGLLDRKLVIESSPVMEQLASLLQRITHPLIILLKKEKEKEKPAEVEKSNEASQTAPEAGTESQSSEQATGGTDVEMTSTPAESAVQENPAITESGNPAVPSTEIETAPEKTDEQPAEPSEDKAKKHRMLTPPEVPEYNLRLIINIIAARECPAKTFKDTLSLITNLSTIPEAKEIFGKELINQAKDLGQNILRDLDELSVQITKATSGTDVQGMALARFSPASSDQAKLLRVITALDFLFDPKRADTQDKPTTSNLEGLESQQKEDILTTLYENSTFESLWNRLSECLTAIRNRGNMFNVANILLPLIEVLMVVCKNTTLKDASLAPKPVAAQFALASPEPEGREARMEQLFFTFTEEHRKVLNDLVRHTPKLMSGSFSLLVKNSKVLEFDNKRNFFNRKLHTRHELRQPHPSLQLQVRRDQVFLDSYKSLYYKKPDELKYGKLSVRFTGEEGVDAGGVTREWFQAITKQMFDPNYALFIPVASDRTTFHPNTLSGVNEQHLTFFKFIGRVLGKALYEGRVLDCHFSRAVYKRILGRTTSVKDMESLDLDYYKSLLWILENDITDVITETFSLEQEAFGVTKIVDLVEDGRNVAVTEDNKQEYVRLVVEHKMIGSVKEQLDHFLQGFHEIVGEELISIFNEQELELLISGLPDIDVDDWKNNTEYHNYQASSPQIQWFWRAMRSFDKEERAKLLQFVTGTSKVPLNGFKELEGMNGFSRFNIHRDYGSKERLPSSHTCFNQLDLPEYDSYDELRKALYTAMTAGGEYFGFA